MESSSWVNIIPLTPQKEVVLKPLRNIPSLIRTGVITHALVIAAFYRYYMEYADSRR